MLLSLPKNNILAFFYLNLFRKKRLDCQLFCIFAVGKFIFANRGIGASEAECCSGGNFHINF